MLDKRREGEAMLKLRKAAIQGTARASSEHRRRPSLCRHGAALFHRKKRDTGIEPVSQAWEARVLPLYESREDVRSTRASRNGFCFGATHAALRQNAFKTN